MKSQTRKEICKTFLFYFSVGLKKRWIDETQRINKNGYHYRKGGAVNCPVIYNFSSIIEKLRVTEKTSLWPKIR